jgi:hypothetical protein
MEGNRQGPEGTHFEESSLIIILERASLITVMYGGQKIALDPDIQTDIVNALKLVESINNVRRVDEGNRGCKGTGDSSSSP